MAAPKFEGWLGKTPESVKGKMEWGPYEPKKWTEDDVDIEISHCGVCGSDLHMLRSGWGETPYRTLLLVPFTVSDPPLLRETTPPGGRVSQQQKSPFANTHVS